MSAETLLDVRDLHVHHRNRGASWRARAHLLHAVRGVSFHIATGESVGLVGESGCGKTTLSRAVLRLVRASAGQILFQGQDITRLQGARLRALRRKLQLVFQDAYGALDPRMTVGESIGEALDIHRLAPGREARRSRIRDLLDNVGLEPSQAGRYPHEFSGGQRQRIGIARALAAEPSLLVCDEPVSALDVSVQAQIVNLLQDLQRERGLAFLFIAHDLAVVEHISRRILVMYLGQIVESGETKAVCRQPRHPYTQALLSAIPQLKPPPAAGRSVLGGEIPSLLKIPDGCPFHPRCPIAEPRCRSVAPNWREVAPGHWVACHLA